MNFDEAFDRLMGHEGGYVNDPRDPGGETNWGISKRSYPNVDIEGLSREAAKEIYRRDYWGRANADRFDGAIAFQVFDAAVNSGIGAAIRMLQRAVGVVDDGIVGPITLAAISSKPVVSVVALFNAERLEFMTDLSTWRTFGRGWAKRIAQNIRDGIADA
jgi:lysozyme family protein